MYITDKFILNESGQPVAEPDLYKWGRWFEDSREKRVVAQEMVGACKISTVFLGLNHRYGDGPPILWESMVFGGPLNGECDRCAGGREQAEAMHRDMVEKVKRAL